MDDEIEKMVEQWMNDINMRILSWFGLSGMGPAYKILDDIWEFTELRSRVESGIRKYTDRKIQEDRLGR